MIDARAMIERMRAKHWLGDEAKLGIVASFGTKSVVDTDRNNRDLLVVATTDDIDLDDEVVIPGGADLSYIRQNRKVFADHRYEVESIVGQLRSLSPWPTKKAQRGWLARVRLATNPIGEAVKLIVEETGSIGASIGFEATDFGPPTDDEKKLYSRGGREPKSVVRSYKMLELSLTAIPCNVACQTMGFALGDESKSERIVSMVKSGRIDRRAASMLGVPVQSVRKRKIVVLCGD